MKKITFLLLSICCIFFLNVEAKGDKPSNQVTVLQINIWQEGTVVPKGFEAIGNEIARLSPDVVLFSEIRNYNDTDFIQRIKQYLEKAGHRYYGESSEKSLDVGLISKYPIVEQMPNYEEGKKVGNVLKTKINIHGRQFLFYSAHLDYTNYACYLPRGYNGVTWKKMEQPIVDPVEILKANRLSMRDEAIRDVIEDVKKEDKDQIIILGGDFNEPSHLDWKENTKNLFDHRGAVVPWDCSMMLTQFGFVDSFRKKYPNPVTHPGFSFPSDNKSVDVSKLAWAPDADERDRIDFIYYLPNKYFKLKDVKIVGPSESIIRGKRSSKDSKDEFIEPLDVWPTDHKAFLATFQIK